MEYIHPSIGHFCLMMKTDLFNNQEISIKKKIPKFKENENSYLVDILSELAFYLSGLHNSH